MPRPIVFRVTAQTIRACRQATALPNIVQRLHDARLDDALSTWNGRGLRLPITSAQLIRGLGSEHVQRLAVACGMSVTVAASVRAELLPPVIEFLAPGGNVPDQQQLSDAVDTLRRTLRV